MPKVGEGTYGCVYDPSLKCNTQKPDNFYEGKVSKATTLNNAENEINEQSIIDKIDDNYKYHLNPPHLCKLSDEDLKYISDCRVFIKNPNSEKTLLIMKNGGYNLEDFITRFFRSKQTLKEKQKIIYDFWVNSENLINALKEMKQHHIFHNDLKPQNILFNEDTHELNIIDFGLMSKNVNCTHNWHFSYPPETIFYDMSEVRFKEISNYDNDEFRNFFYKKDVPHYNQEKPFLIKYITFLEYAAKNEYTHSKYKEEYHFFNKEALINHFSLNFLKNTTLKQLKRIYNETMDVYGMGFSLIYVLINTFFYLKNNDLFITNMYKLLFSMIHPNCFERIDVHTLFLRYKEVLNLLNTDNTTSSINSKSLTISNKNLKKYTVTLPRRVINRKVPKCKDNEELNPENNKCRKKCKDGQVRNLITQRCSKEAKVKHKNKIKTLKNKSVKVKRKNKIKTLKIKPVKVPKCKDNEELNPENNKCRKKCKDGQVRNLITQRCSKEAKLKHKKKSKTLKIKLVKVPKCKDNEELNPENNKCRKKCKDGQVRNLITQRCNKIK